MTEKILTASIIFKPMQLFSFPWWFSGLILDEFTHHRYKRITGIVFRKQEWNHERVRSQLDPTTFLQ
jgi:hypothetical protein